MRVDKPRFTDEGEIDECVQCPLNPFGRSVCQSWMRGHKTKNDGRAGDCPTADTYDEAVAEACRLAEQAEKGEKE